MDSPKIGSSSGSQRRRLTKKPPSAHSQHYASSILSATVDGRVDTQSLGSKRSSSSLRRAPSAPLASRAPASLASDSSPRFPAAPSSPALSPASRSPTSSSILPGGESAALSSVPSLSHARPLHRRADAQQPRSRPPGALPPLSTKTSDELIGAPFDGTAILNRIEATRSLAQNNHDPSKNSSSGTNANHGQGPPRSAPAQSPRPNPDTRAMGHSPPPLRQSATFPGTDLPVLNEKAAAPKMDAAPLPKRYSDETKESKLPSMLRKKSGFSGFMTSLVGSPKKPLISAPENPVHVTHVGYDSSTGQFTVGGPVASAPGRPAALTRWTGAAQGVAAADQRERHHRKGHARAPANPRRRPDILQGNPREAAGGPAIREVP